jgi:hypothetical protein
MTPFTLARAALAVALLSAAALAFGAVAPASAHEQLASSSPGVGERVDTAPETVELTFTADLITIGAVVIVVDAEGHNWSDGEPLLDGAVVTQYLEAPLPEGSYQVRWRVVSGDGHPISDTFMFGVGVEPTPFEAVPADSPTAASTDSPAAAPAGSAPEGTDAPRLIIVAAIGAALALALYLTLTAAGRRRGPRTPAAASADDSGTQKNPEGEPQ